MCMRYIAMLGFISFAMLICSCSSDQNRYETITYEMQDFDQRFGTEGDTVNGFVSVAAEYPDMLKASATGVADSVAAAIQLFLLRPLEGSVPFQSLDHIAREYIRAFKEGHDPAWPNGYGWTMIRKAVVETDTLNVFALSLIEARYMGVDNQFADRRYANFDTRSGRRYELDDLFVAGYDTFLDRAAEEAFRRIRRLDLAQPLAEAGFTFDSTAGFRHNSNFLIEPNALTFYFNRGEVGPAELGATEYSIPYHVLTPIVRPGGPLAPFVPEPRA